MSLAPAAWPREDLALGHAGGHDHLDVAHLADRHRPPHERAALPRAHHARLVERDRLARQREDVVALLDDHVHGGERSGIKTASERQSKQRHEPRTAGVTELVMASGASCTTFPSNDTPGYASRVTRACCPTSTRLRSTWLTLALTCIDFGSTTLTIGMPGRTSSPSCSSVIAEP